MYLTLPDVRVLAKSNPTMTAFMQLRAAQAEAEGRKVRRAYQWVSYRRISPHLKRAVLVAEDSAFWDHEGIDIEQIKVSIETAIEKGDTPRGASTITQQLAKNLYLSPSQNPLRKVKELIITRRLEAALPKARILELYLNVVEWGDGIWGAEAAARRYFGVSAASLTRAQAALLAGALINPVRYSPGNPPARLLRRQQIILARMGSVEPPAPPPTRLTGIRRAGAAGSAGSARRRRGAHGGRGGGTAIRRGVHASGAQLEELSSEFRRQSVRAVWRMCPACRHQDPAGTRRVSARRLAAFGRRLGDDKLRAIRGLQEDPSHVFSEHPDGEELNATDERNQAGGGRPARYNAIRGHPHKQDPAKVGARQQCHAEAERNSQSQRHHREGREAVDGERQHPLPGVGRRPTGAGAHLEAHVVNIEAHPVHESAEKPQRSLDAQQSIDDPPIEQSEVGRTPDDVDSRQHRPQAVETVRGGPLQPSFVSGGLSNGLDDQVASLPRVDQ